MALVRAARRRTLQASRSPGRARKTVTVEDRTSAATKGLPATWTRTDEWYEFRTASTPARARAGHGGRATATWAPSALAWCHRYDGGRSVYTAMGHTQESFTEPPFLATCWARSRWPPAARGSTVRLRSPFPILLALASRRAVGHRPAAPTPEASASPPQETPGTDGDARRTPPPAPGDGSSPRDQLGHRRSR